MKNLKSQTLHPKTGAHIYAKGISVYNIVYLTYNIAVYIQQRICLILQMYIYIYQYLILVSDQKGPRGCICGKK